MKRASIRPLHLAAALLLSILTACGTGAPAPGSLPPASVTPTPSSTVREAVQRLASENPGSVNVYLVPTANGVFAMDSGRNAAGGRQAAAAVRRSGRPLLAVLITHPHPDHVGGLGELHRAYPDAPIYASAATIRWMRTDPLKFYPLAHRLDPDFPSRLTYPNRSFAAGASLDIDGVRLETAQFEPGESQTSTAYYNPEGGELYAGDLTDNRATPALLEGHTCGWLTNLDQLQQRFPDAGTVYPGHGAPAAAGPQIDAQRAYLQRVRTLVRAATGVTTAKGRQVSAAEQASIVRTLEQDFPNYPSVASLPNLLAVNVKAVVTEISAERATTLPAACR